MKRIALLIGLIGMLVPGIANAELTQMRQVVFGMD